jgi:hypothetical protein
LFDPGEADSLAHVDRLLSLWTLGGDEQSCRRRRKPESSIVSVFVGRGEHRACIGVVTSLPAVSLADEDGVSFWLPGLFGSLAAVPQQSGWQLTVMNYYDSVSASGSVAAAREITIGKLSPTVSVNLNVSVNERIFLDRRDQCLLSDTPENFLQTTCINQARLCAAP